MRDTRTHGRLYATVGVMCDRYRPHTRTHTKPKLINRVGSANEEEELKTKNQRNKQTRGGDILWGIRIDAP